jgi:signal transduction histidine kinase
VIEFKDTGEGMNDEQQRRAFTSLLNSTKRSGTGLGLAIVHRIVEAHHGKLTLRSHVGKGTSISIDLPTEF